MHADFVLEVQLFRFRNPTGRTTIGICCDFDCSDGCDNRFVFCLRPSGSVSTSEDNCPLGRYRTGVIAGNDEVFLRGVLDPTQDITNPLNFTGPLWPVSCICNNPAAHNCWQMKVSLFLNRELFSCISR